MASEMHRSMKRIICTRFPIQGERSRAGLTAIPMRFVELAAFCELNFMHVFDLLSALPKKFRVS